MFWGLIMEPGKRYTQTVERAFHVSMACLEQNIADNNDVNVMLVFDNKEFILCILNKNKAAQTQLDLNFQSGDKIAFMSTGKGRVHLTGYLLETDDEDDEDLDDDTLNDPNLDLSDSFERTNSFTKGSGKRKNEPQLKKSKNKKVKLDESEEKMSSDDDDDDDDDDDSNLGDSDLMVESDEDEEDDDDDDLDDDDDEELSDVDMEIPSPKQKTPEGKKKDKSMNKTPNEQKNKMKTPVSENQKKKNKTPKDKQQKDKTPNEKQGGNTPHNKSPGNQMNGMPGQQQSGKKNKKGLDTSKMGKSPGEDTPKGAKTPGDTPKGSETPGGGTPQKRVLEGGVVIEDIVVGKGPVAKPGRHVSVYYVGRLKNNNKQFDSSTAGPGFKFRLGHNEVIRGWDIGVNGMKLGGKRKIICPPQFAYGSKGSPPVIPPNSALVFEVELKAVN